MPNKTSNKSNLSKNSLKATISTLSLLMLSQASLAQFSPGQVSIQSVTLAGSGCPAGTARAVLAPDGSSLTVMYDQFEARADSAQPLARKNCEVLVKIRKPVIYAFAVESADFRGFVGLDHGTRATQKVKVETGSGKLAKVNVNLAQQAWRGPLNENFTISAVKPVEGLKYLSCFQPKKDAQLKIKSEIVVENGGGSSQGLITIDSFDGSLVQKYNLKWINCLQAGIGLIDFLRGGR